MKTLTSLKLREADMDDAAILYAWRNDPETRKWSRTMDEISYPMHEIWLERMLADPMVAIFIGVDDILPVGVVRAELWPYEGGSKRRVISIAVDAGVRGNGYGRLLLEQIGQKYPNENLDAYIHPKNTTSIKLFTSLGYCEVVNRDDSVFMLFTRGPLMI